MDKVNYICNILNNPEINSLQRLSEVLNDLFEESTIKDLEKVTSDIVDSQFLEELEKLSEVVKISFGKSLRDIKCKIHDEDLRVHEVYLRYDGVKKLKVVSTDIPIPSFEQSYKSIEEVVEIFQSHTKSLQSYFYELEKIDNNCVVVEPLKPTLKDDYRNIRIDSKTWLHIEVTPDGSPTNVHLIGRSETWQNKLQSGILNWDHDKNIVENIKMIFDLNDSTILSKSMTVDRPNADDGDNEDITCAICFCVELPDQPGIPQPLCQNSNCDVYFHKDCLYEWLVACEGGRPPAFGVINGSCPTCLHPISCSKQ